MKIGLYPGTFNPIHIGHLTVINYSIENLELDLLYVIPNKYPVHKKRKYLIDPENRLKMIEISTESMCYSSKIKVSDFEIKSDQDSYTFLTVEHFRNLYPLDNLFLILGIDSIIYYYWHNFEIIFKSVDFLVVINNLCIKDDIFEFFSDKLYELNLKGEQHNEDLLEIIHKDPDWKRKFILLDIPIIKVSSSLIWERLEEGRAIDYWVSEKVKDMLYKSYMNRIPK
ncbi:MAG: nicotinate (nicotinamide) nucleotide adenylyltransferase [Candidatus Calescibacterium sp.]|nr:nicotinate (nicotinamide) nucleotide adenylyltransferase [Candidatus Calescibacterium sp.]MCX7971677.1 nicotinate (nicotinamide) nucleotide adenylyltransferase [bacterium]MDW8195283.1 nicotinate (nicotinamide) nucleotide adenylyltransferase [Candidatus Calescibacterium sp.]